MDKIKELSQQLLLDGVVSCVIGFAEGSLPETVRPHIAFTPEEADGFIFDARCTNNLSVYLTRRYSLTGKKKPAGIFAKSCDVRAIVGLIQEHQLKRDEVYIIGVPCTGTSDSKDGKTSGLSSGVQRCLECQSHTPAIYDVLAADPVNIPASAHLYSRVNKIEDMPLKERWGFWQAEFDKCIRCYACRQACPLCYCEQCITDKTCPQWIDSAAHPAGNLAWHLTRAFHLAGRCIGCGECERACSQNIPLGLLNEKLRKEVQEQFGYTAGLDFSAKPPVITYSPNDNQEFIQ